MAIYGADAITFDGAYGHRYWFDEPFTFTGIDEFDKKLSGFPVAVFVPEHRRREETPLIIALQGMSAPYGWNAFIVPKLTSMGIAVALFDTPFAGERSLARVFNGMVHHEIMPLVERGVRFDTKLLLQVFRSTALDIARVQNFCASQYGLTNNRVGLFGVSMGVLLGAYAFTTEGIGERLLGAIGHANLQAFARTWGRLWLPELAASGMGRILETVISRTKKREFLPLINLLQVANNLKKPDEYGFACNPMNYVDRVTPYRRIRFLVGANDPIVNVRDARKCAEQFPDGTCYVVPGLAHGVNKWGSSFVDHVRYFLATQLGDWQ
ncbi:hypothetical protein DSM106972_032180 [Dulcicalothrix desertica PCC 7102]|uniref:Alpha/beta hydrolase n=1 Tax=Dulcicalothrix desertica PCC 7102 TaxID=232991 RepID=A0A433VIW0_9CYAN|nr:alpha/beta hydrolase [Dulcicalothrix desertica]RUT06012.1 hypothetical protein DSM106972_032180 [Dulcicalothrix desertica PCC 7102]TWH54322.1 hypothetical protein CAL7102_02341 [Dulcicalothrix desertica PCC 7102]